MMNQINNPGLEKFDISDYNGSSGVNFYEQDKILQRMVDRYSSFFTQDHRKDMHNHLSGYGNLLGGILNDLTLASHKEGKYGEIKKYDSVGNRIDEIIYSEEQLQSRKISYDYGVVNLIRFIIKASRIHVGLGACGNSRRAIMEASAYSKFRTAYGKNIHTFPAYKSQLVELQILQSICTISNFRMVYHAEQNTKLQDLLIPLMKYKASSLASYICKSAMLCLGGNGIIADFSPIPRLLNDSIINESWEGTHLIISDHCMHALGKDKVRKEWNEELSANIKLASSIQVFSDLIVFFHNLLTQWEELFSNSKQWKDANRLFIIDKTYEIFSLSLIIQEAASQYDKQNKIHFYYDHQEEIYQDIAYAYKEILEFGVGAYKAPKGIFMNQDKLDRLLEYLS